MYSWHGTTWFVLSCKWCQCLQSGKDPKLHYTFAWAILHERLALLASFPGSPPLPIHIFVGGKGRGWEWGYRTAALGRTIWKKFQLYLCRHWLDLPLLHFSILTQAKKNAMEPLNYGHFPFFATKSPKQHPSLPFWAILLLNLAIHKIRQN